MNLPHLRFSPAAVFVEFAPSHVLAVAAVSLAVLIGWHILRNFRTPPGPGEGDRP